MTDQPPAVTAAKKAARNAGRISLGSSTVLSVTGAVPFIDWLFTLSITDPASRPNLAVTSFIAGVIVAGINLGLQLMLRGKDAVAADLQGDNEHA
jgi:hypothetical protein